MTSTESEHLRDISFLAELTPEALRAVADLATEVQVPPGHLLVERGQAGSGMFLLEEGTVEVDLGEGRRLELGPGEFFGELSLLTDRHRTARVHALTGVKCLAISRIDFLNLIQNEPSMSLAMLRSLAERLIEAQSGT